MSGLDRAWRNVRRVLIAAFTENVGLKAFSLIVALGLAAYSRGQLDRTQRTIPIGVVLRLPPDSRHRELMTPMPANVDATVVGTTRAVDRLIQTGAPPIEIDLREGTAETVSFDRTLFSLPPDIELKYVDPPSVTLEWQDVISRTIPIQASRTGLPAKGYEVTGTQEVDPKEITVKGPSSLVEVLQFARLAAFDVSGLTEGVYRRRLAIDDPPPRVRYLGAKSATVTVEIVRRQSEAKFERRPVEIVGPVRGQAIPSVVDVRVSGAPEIVVALRADQIVPRVDLASAGIDLKTQHHGSTTLKVRVDLAGAEAECQPPTVTVHW